MKLSSTINFLQSTMKAAKVWRGYHLDSKWSPSFAKKKIVTISEWKLEIWPQWKLEICPPVSDGSALPGGRILMSELDAGYTKVGLQQLWNKSNQKLQPRRLTFIYNAYHNCQSWRIGGRNQTCESTATLSAWEEEQSQEDWKVNLKAKKIRKVQMGKRCQS